ncbi:hypothetical protein ACWEN3_20955 [Streptomyces sp. NPDC004561]
MSTVGEANAAPTRRRGKPQAPNIVAGGIEIRTTDGGPLTAQVNGAQR